MNPVQEPVLATPNSRSRDSSRACKFGCGLGTAEEKGRATKAAIFLNPQNHRWETEDEYLSGNVRAKLAVAEAAALADEQFVGNVEALKLVQPADLAAAEIDARLGSTWIPREDIRQFAEELLGEGGVSVSHAPQLGLWVVQGSCWGGDAEPPYRLGGIFQHVLGTTLLPTRSPLSEIIACISRPDQVPLLACFVFPTVMALQRGSLWLALRLPQKSDAANRSSEFCIGGVS